jgi:hypothetical protein
MRRTSRWKRLLGAPWLYGQHYWRARQYAAPWDACVRAWRLTVLFVR